MVWVFADPGEFPRPSHGPSFYRQKGQPRLAFFGDNPDHAGRLFIDIEADPIDFVREAWASIESLSLISDEVLFYAHHADNTTGARLNSVEASTPKPLKIGEPFRRATLYQIEKASQYA